MYISPEGGRQVAAEVFTSPQTERTENCLEQVHATLEADRKNVVTLTDLILLN